MKEFKVNHYINNHLEKKYKLKINELIHWINSHSKAKFLSWYQSTLTFSITWSKENHQYWLIDWLIDHTLLWHQFKFNSWEKTMLCVLNEQNSLRKKITYQLHSDCTSLRQQRWNNSISNKSITSIQRVTLEFLMHVYAVFLLYIVLALLFVNDILYNDVSIFDHEDHDFFALVMLMIVMSKLCSLLDDYHSSSKKICDERKMYMMKR